MTDPIAPLAILLAEDSDDDVVLIREVLVEDGIAQIIHVVTDGEEALAYLRRQGPYQQAPRPDLLLLDLNMPRMNGLEVLRAIKQDPLLRPLPIIILTTSKREEDVALAYALGVCCFLVKPVEFLAFRALVRTSASYWGQVARLPRVGR